MVLDDQGFAELAVALRELLDRAAEIEAASAERTIDDDHQHEEIPAGLVMMLFEAPPASTGLPLPAVAAHAAGNAGARRRVQSG
jgi:hypothetical protein